CVGAATNQVVPMANGTRWRLPLNQATEYRWSTNALRLWSLVPAGATWKYNDSGANLGDSWRGTNYDDSAWPSGSAQLGFGDGDETTLIASNRQVTTYFRSSFVFTNTNHLSALALRLLRDDGAVVYLNGTEVFRSNLPTNTPISFNTPASASVPAADETVTYYSQTVDPNLLHLGTNVLAVEVHQASGVMDDLSFDLDLAAEIWPRPPELLARSQPGRLELAWPSWAEGAALWFATNLALPVLWQRATNAVVTTNGEASVPITPGSGTRFFRLQGP
ncbi:MAG TPA: hypothetical protein VNZ22_05715, partial [Bacillota bacterium]|nr:hypothetical protein [Bacillota bacterium]